MTTDDTDKRGTSRLWWVPFYCATGAVADCLPAKRAGKKPASTLAIYRAKSLKCLLSSYPENADENPAGWLECHKNTVEIRLKDSGIYGGA